MLFNNNCVIVIIIIINIMKIVIVIVIVIMYRLAYFVKLQISYTTVPQKK